MCCPGRPPLRCDPPAQPTLERHVCERRSAPQSAWRTSLASVTECRVGDAITWRRIRAVVEWRDQLVDSDSACRSVRLRPNLRSPVGSGFARRWLVRSRPGPSRAKARDATRPPGGQRCGDSKSCLYAVGVPIPKPVAHPADVSLSEGLGAGPKNLGARQREALLCQDGGQSIVPVPSLIWVGTRSVHSWFVENPITFDLNPDQKVVDLEHSSSEIGFRSHSQSSRNAQRLRPWERSRAGTVRYRIRAEVESSSCWEGPIIGWSDRASGSAARSGTRVVAVAV